MSEQSTTVALLQRIQQVADNILADSAETSQSTYTTDFISNATFAIALAPLSLPDALTPQLVSLGVPHHTATNISDVYLRKAMELKTASEVNLRTTWAKLASSPRPETAMPLQNLLHQFSEVYRHTYQSSLSKWAQQAIEVARSHISTKASSTDESLHHRGKKSKRQFKSEYLPLFEFAFEKDRFPSREDKKHLARISSMSYRQVCVWFQNRRCRHASRVKSHHATPPPQTFEEMKERLGASAREALANPPPVRSREEPVRRGAVAPHVRVLDDDGVASPGPGESTRAVSLEATEDGYDSEERDELEDDDFLGNSTYQLPTSAALPTNPLSPLKTPTAGVFPAVYAPSQLTFDPFVVEHQPWLRTPGAPRTHTRSLIDPTPEAIADILGGFSSMDVEMSDASTKTSGAGLGMRNAVTGRLEKPLPRRSASPRTPTTRQPVQRSLSASSSGSCISWSSGESTALSRSSSYSTIASSALDSPHLSEISLLTPSECAVDVPSDYAPSPVSERNMCAGAETACVADSPVDEDATAGSLTATCAPAWESAAESRVDAWAMELPVQEDKASPSKWEQLLAAASVATS